MAIEHRPWVPENFQQGLFEGKKILIVGHSHHGDGPDDNDTTEGVLLHVMHLMEPRWNIAFFNQIRDYFGHSDHREFWPKVAFFNYVPALIGTSDQRYARMSDPEVIQQASDRFERILTQLRPDMTFVFSKAIHGMLPVATPIPMPVPEVSKSYLRSDSAKSPVYLLRHPERAPKQAMTSAVQAMLAR